MNHLEKLENLLHAVVAFAFGVGLFAFVAPPARADAADDWAAYRVAHNLPVYPKPSRPEELPRDAGPVPESPAAEPLSEGFGGDAAGSEPAESCRFAVELARSDGNALGEDQWCK